MREGAHGLHLRSGPQLREVQTLRPLDPTQPLASTPIEARPRRLFHGGAIPEALVRTRGHADAVGTQARLSFLAPLSLDAAQPKEAPFRGALAVSPKTASRANASTRRAEGGPEGPLDGPTTA